MESFNTSMSVPSSMSSKLLPGIINEVYPYNSFAEAKISCGTAIDGVFLTFCSACNVSNTSMFSFSFKSR